MEAIDITINNDAKEIGLAELITSLIRDNCLQNEKKAKIFKNLSGEVKISATDAEVFIILTFDRGKLIVRNGENIPIPFEIIAGSEDIINISNIKLFMTYPLLTNREGFKIIREIIKGRIVIRGIITNIIFGLNLLRIISVN